MPPPSLSLVLYSFFLLLSPVSLLNRTLTYALTIPLSSLLPLYRALIFSRAPILLLSRFGQRSQRADVL